MTDIAPATFDEAMTRAGEALSEVERLVPGPALDAVRKLTRALLDAHHRGLESLLLSVSEQPNGRDLMIALGASPEVSSLLALHGLHPDPCEKRVRRAIDRANRALGKGSAVELLALDGNLARVHVATSHQDGFDLAQRLTEDSVAAEAPEVCLEFQPSSFRSRGLVELRRPVKERKEPV